MKVAPSLIASRLPHGMLLLLLAAFLSVWTIELAFGAPQDQERWNHKYDTDNYLFGRDPIPFLKDHIDLLPKGKALDLAMGEGRNGVYLATQGFEVTGVDISETGLHKAQALASEKGVPLTTLLADLEQYEIPPNTFDVIICTYYLQRDLFPKIAAALKPGGMVLIETYTMDHLQYRPTFNPAYLLEPNELLGLLPGLRVWRYQDVDDGYTAFASILAQKPH
ncbi:MAG: class I SAM-dependent methyltransferase [Nitrospirales bacterium]|nr:class I SAM-dependent methyltransferase [Nitrospirales bacterium]